MVAIWHQGSLFEFTFMQPEPDSFKAALDVWSVLVDYVLSQRCSGFVSVVIFERFLRS